MYDFGLSLSGAKEDQVWEEVYFRERKKMEKYAGTSLCGGIVKGKLFVLKGKKQFVEKRTVQDTEAEIKRYEAAERENVEEFKRLYEKAVRQAGKGNALIFEAYGMILTGEEYRNFVRQIIETQRVNAEYAVSVAGAHFSELFSGMKDEYFQGRSADFAELSQHVICCLTGERERKEQIEKIGEPVILITDRLTPAELFRFDPRLLRGIVMQYGAGNSHIAILARAMNIPALTGVELRREWQGQRAILDGNAGFLIVNPAKEILENYAGKSQKEVPGDDAGKSEKEIPGDYVGKTEKEIHGDYAGKQKMNLYANIGSIEELKSALECGAEGVGLFRSEWLYMNSREWPGQEEQFEIYRRLVQTMRGKKVIIRTLDIGGEKLTDYQNMEREENPAMGLRGIRFGIENPEILKTQLRALIRASAYGKIGILYPMITSVWEVRAVKEMAEEIKNEFDENGILYGDFEQGVMIETPAAVMISAQLAKEADFFSIGTNDLTQYTLGIDRQNNRLDRFYDTHHEAILRMISLTVDNGHREKIRVEICGELAADISLSKKFAEMGVDALSMSPASILNVRSVIATC